MAITLEDLLKKDTPTATATPLTATKVDLPTMINQYLDKVVKILELGNNIVNNALRIKASVSGATASASASSQVAQMEEIIKAKATEIPKVQI